MTFTTIPASGARLTAGTLSSLITDVRPLFVRKTAAETVNNSTTLQDDDQLLLSVAASTTYEMTLRLAINSGTTPDFKFDFTYPTSATATWQVLALEPGVTTAGFQGPFTQATVHSIGTSGSDQVALITGTWIISTTAGTIQLRWAQNTANASNTQVLSGSYFKLRKVE